MTDQKPHPIILEKLVFTRSSVIAVPEHQVAESRNIEGPDNTLNVSKIDDEPGRYSATMRTVINPDMDKKWPYSIDMECMALLTADDTLSQEDAMRGVMITAHSVLFGAIREAVAWLTGRQPYGGVMLGLSVLRAQEDRSQDKK